jgi:DNA polymerase III subunit gamma/tau
MSYQVIARKYRPQTFEAVVGQKPIVTTLRNAVAQSRIHHAYLFSGPRGIGKTTVARLLAKALNCAKGPTPDPCNACSSCAEIAQSRSMDVLEIDGASNRGIDNVRELRETVRYAPARDRYKVFIIDEVHMLTDPAWNALLKTLEEPPPNVVFIFATTEYREIPRTILSRCQHFEFRKVPPAELLAHLKSVAEGEKVTVEPGVFELLIRVAEGSLRDALSALDQVVAFSGANVTDEQARTILGVVDRELITDFFKAVRERDCGRLVGIIDTVFEKGHQPVEFLEDLMAHARDLLLARAVPDPERYVAGTPAEIAALAKEAAGFGEDDLLRLLELMTREEPRLKHSTHARFLLEALAIKLARLADLEPIEAILARLEGAGGPTTGVPGNGPGAPPRPRPGVATAPVGGGAPAPTAGGASPTAGAVSPTTAPLTTASPTTASPTTAPPKAASPAPAGPAGLRDAAAEAPDGDPIGALRAAIARTPPPQAKVPNSRPVRPAEGLAPSEPARAMPPRSSGTDAAADASNGSPSLVQSIVERVRGERSAIASMLDQATSVEMIGDTLRILFDEPQEFFREKVKSREVSGYLTGIARAVAGKNLKLEVEAAPASAAPAMPRRGPGAGASAGGGPGAATGRLTDAAGRRALIDQAAQEPAVRSLLDLFGGEIIDIEPI